MKTPKTQRRFNISDQNLNLLKEMHRHQNQSFSDALNTILNFVRNKLHRRILTWENLISQGDTNEDT